MTTEAVNNSCDEQNRWQEFCDNEARVAAAEFASSFYQYVNGELGEAARVNLSYRDFLRRFVESFCDHFEAEYLRRTAKSTTSSDANSTRQTPESEGSAKNQNNKRTVRVSSPEFSDYSDKDAEATPAKPASKPFFRRLSFKSFKKGKGLFHKQSSTEKEMTAEERRLEKNARTKLSKIVVECRKEGIINAMIIENTDVPDVPPKFEKCRLSLVKASAGYILEFYQGSKGKPLHGIFCSSIIETRETSDLEMPDHENTFVLKTMDKEFIIETKDEMEMKSWLATIRYCIRSTYMADLSNDSLMNESMMHGSVSMSMDSDRVRSNSSSKSTRSMIEHVDEQGNPPDLPPRLRATSHSNLDLRLSDQENEQNGTEGGSALGTEVDHSSSLREYPWFHGTLPRSDAAMLVLHHGVEGHGTFLVRQSETRKGEYVLTFNFQGRAKHLRMTLSESGLCRVQHLVFPGIYDMLDHFRAHPIPLESGGTADVKLTEYVIANHPANTTTPASTASASGSAATVLSSATASFATHQPVERRPAPLPEPREVITIAGPVRMRTESLERLEQQQRQQQQQQQNGEQASTSRAVQNAYSFL